MTGDRRYRPAVPAELSEVFVAEGLEVLGIVSALPDHGDEVYRRREREHREYREWLRMGYHGTMRYLERHSEGKFNPRAILEGCRSVVLVGLNYFQHVPALGDARAGRVARYAWGRDYHKTLGGKLKRVCNELRDRYPGHMFRGFTDATPLAERTFAEEAGIGFVGRNTLLINARLGSWFVIGEILTTAPLPPSNPPAGVHGACPRSCRNCIDVCPTGALEGPHRINAARCISYLTIELRGSIPPELRPLIGEWLFGCDLCQEVCPLNAVADPSTEPDFTVWKAGPQQEIEAVLAIENDQEFTARFAGTPLMRAKRSGLLRNACIVAANRGARELLPALRRRAGDHDATIAEHARWAVDRLSE